MRHRRRARIKGESNGLSPRSPVGDTTTYSTPPGGTPHDSGQTMEFFNMQNGDAPLLKSLADQYTMSDNYHQPVLGGTGPDSQPLGFADQVFFSDGMAIP